QIRKRSLSALRHHAQIEIDGCRIEYRRAHLRCDEPLPDQLIQLELIGCEISLDGVRPTRGICGTNRLMRFLRVLGLAALVKLDGFGDEVRAKKRAYVITRLIRGDFRDT